MNALLLSLVWVVASPPVYEATIDGSRLQQSVLQIEAKLSGQESPDVRWCVPIVGAGAGLQQAQAKTSKGVWAALARASDDPDCFVLPAHVGSPPSVRYQVDLQALERARPDPDFAQRYDGGWLTNDQAFLLRPETYLVAMRANLIFRGFGDVFSVWDRDDKSVEPTFSASSAQLGGGAYWSLATKRGANAASTAKTLTVSDRIRAVRLLPGSTNSVSDATLIGWLRAATNGHATFGEHADPDARMVNVFLVERRGDDAGIFGTVLHRHRGSVVLWFGGQGSEASYRRDWLAVHELFHLKMPETKQRACWFTEGFTTYYQEVLRVRSGALTPQQMWDDLHDGLVRFGQPRGSSLQKDSDELWQTHRYQKVYWSGAGLALLCDWKLRERGSSLDAFLAKQRAASDEAPLQETELIRLLEEATEKNFVTDFLNASTSVDYSAAYRALGLVVVDGKTLALSPSKWREAIERGP